MNLLCVILDPPYKCGIPRIPLFTFIGVSFVSGAHFGLNNHIGYEFEDNGGYVKAVSCEVK